jgi:peptidoglycan hydrolase-like protein with peptidoglycan-binding domain
MANRAKQPAPNAAMVQFPPEADGDFGLVTETQVVSWQKKLNERFGIGSGKLVEVEEPCAL